MDQHYEIDNQRYWRREWDSKSKCPLIPLKLLKNRNAKNSEDGQNAILKYV